MDKRDASRLFRDRMEQLLSRSGRNRSGFAREIGVDRSALSQLLSEEVTRLPRAETLIRIASTCDVSLDWLLGLSQAEDVTAAIKPSLELEEAQNGQDTTLLYEWHTEAAGTKIRYIPTTIPDLLRTDAVISYESRENKRTLASRIDEANNRLAYTRRPETDMEVCMPMQRLVDLAQGTGTWSDLAEPARMAQLDHMAKLIDDLYPSFRLYLYDGQVNFAAPYTVFGPLRATVYIGDMYLVLNAKEGVTALTRHFDNLIRAANVQAHEVADWIAALRDNTT
ncbi:XRE family transcriptional regulator [Oricola cellulosilytica]|uniref:XRE family transcriptional regulator n=1 Tax=Oricola cellulosilytica TaxID=1429082 RepID=A0A4R0PFP4_9HYPH|nr:helix-turn-helix transcriptional regulator [Oricola cellulosilytica]TCD16461.1 XRE family transcriptional regulator [Oricola cellulosilytica]